MMNRRLPTRSISRACTVCIFVFALGTTGLLHAEVPSSVKRALAARDYETALIWLNDHAGEADAAFELARLYRLGLGVAADRERSRALLSQAAAAGHERAADLLAKETDRSVAGTSAGTGNATAADRTLLLRAVVSGDRERVDALLARGVSPASVDDLGVSALHHAVTRGDPAISRALLEAGADVNARTREGITPLHRAVASADAPQVELLLHAGADAGLEDDAGWSPRELALRSGDERLQALLEVRTTEAQPLPAVTAENAGGLLTEAVRQGDRTRLNQILDTADVTVTTGERLLRLAIEHGDAETLALLLDRGLQASDAQLFAAIDADCLPCVEQLVTHPSRSSRPVTDPAATDHATALIHAIRSGKEDIALTLIPASTIEAKDAEGRDALWWSVHKGLERAAGQLLDLGAGPAADAEGRTTVHVAAQRGDLKTLERLLTAEHVDQATRSGNTPLLLAAHDGAAGAVRLLLEKGADPELRNAAGDTALIAATRNQHLETARLLLLAGASPNVRNNQFVSAASLIREREEADWLQLLDESERGLLDLVGRLSR